MKVFKSVLAGLFAIAVLYALLGQLLDYSPVGFSALAAAVLAIEFEYFPWIKDWFEPLPDGTKRLVMIGLLAAAVAGAFGLSCLGELAAFACTLIGALDALVVLVLAIGVNQGVHLGTKRS